MPDINSTKFIAVAIAMGFAVPAQAADNQTASPAQSAEATDELTDHQTTMFDLTALDTARRDSDFPFNSNISHKSKSADSPEEQTALFDLRALDSASTDAAAHAGLEISSESKSGDIANKEAADKEDVENLLDLSLEELLAQEITSVAKKSRRIADSAAAVTVITQEDIRRSSARTVPDLLRMVPGMEVAEVQSSTTSVTARGLISRFSANLLVMIDGAAIYSTSISGMFWDQALIPLQDIERIEVIRGPGGTLWGSNSISGIVNIITKQSIDTQDLRINASIGTFDVHGEFGFGRQVTDDLGFRIYGNYRKNNGLDGVDGARPNNSWEGGLAGIRYDFAPTTKDSIVVLGEFSEGRFNERFVEVTSDQGIPTTNIKIQRNRFSSIHALARWKRQVNNNFDFSIQGYYNNLRRTEFGAMIDRHLYDLSLEGRVRASRAHEINFGIAGRISQDEISNAPALSLPSGTNTDRWLTGYIQDDISLVPDRLRLIVGSKFERNNFTGTEIQPSIRLFYRKNPSLAVWASLSRGVRTPLLVQREMIANTTLLREVPGVPIPIPVDNTFTGSPDAQSESVISLEAGIRGSLSDDWSLDIAGFYSEYKHLASAQITGQTPVFVAPSPIPARLQVSQTNSNDGYGRSFGMEVLISGTPTDWWKTELSYSFLDLRTMTPPDSVGLANAAPSSPHQVRFSSQMNLTDRVSLDSILHYVSASVDGRRDAYTDFDIRASYRFNTQIEFSLVGNNLLNERRLEFVNDLLPIEAVYVPRSAYIEARLRF